MSKTANKNIPPIDKVKSLDGSIVISIWKNETADGKINYSMTAPERTYFDKDAKQYKTTTTVFDRDAAELSQMYSRVNDRVRELRDADYQARKAANQEHTPASELTT